MIKISLLRYFVVDVANGIYRKGDVCEVADIFVSRCIGNNETAFLRVFRDDREVRTTTETTCKLNMLLVSGDIRLINPTINF